MTSLTNTADVTLVTPNDVSMISVTSPGGANCEGSGGHCTLRVENPGAYSWWVGVLAERHQRTDDLSSRLRAVAATPDAPAERG